MIVLVLFLPLLTHINTAISAKTVDGYNWVGGHRNEYRDDVSWMMIADNQGIPQLALLTQPPSQDASVPVSATNLTTNIKFYLYTSSNPKKEYQLFRWDARRLRQSSFNRKHPTKILIHGFTHSIASPSIQHIKNAYLARGLYNVIGVDWGELCRGPWYYTASSNVQSVGQFVGSMIDFLSTVGGQSPSMMHLIGHSLGAHVSGVAASSARGAVARVTGLDTALPLFNNKPDSDRLDPSDAELVDAIHTCGDWLGFMDRVGHVDFYPNGGRSAQPGCSLDVLGFCSHSKVVDYFAASISSDFKYPVRKCNSLLQAKRGKCDSPIQGFMGNNLSSPLRGIFWLTTQ